MKWEMSDDYAALVTTTILAVLLIGTVQTYSLMRSWANKYVERLTELFEVRGRISAAIADGREPSDEDLAAAQPTSAFRRMLMPTPAYLAGMLWGAFCCILVYVQVRVLRWAGTHSPAKDPELAWLAFLVCCIGVAVLVLEGSLRAMALVGGGMREIWKSHQEVTGSTDVDAALREHRRRARHTAGGPGTGL